MREHRAKRLARAYGQAMDDIEKVMPQHAEKIRAFVRELRQQAGAERLKRRQHDDWQLVDD